MNKDNFDYLLNGDGNDTTPERLNTPNHQGVSHNQKLDSKKTLNEARSQEVNNEASKENGKMHEDLPSLFAELSRNYDKNEFIAPPERVGIFVRDYINILAGKAGMFKSWQIVRWLRDLSIGGEIFGGVVHNEPPRKCLLIAGELPKCEMERRCRLLEKGDGIERNYTNFIIVDQKESERKNITLMLDDKKGQRNIEALVDFHNPDIVIFDSFISLFSGDESKSTDVNPVMAFLERLAAKNHTATTIVHHLRKRFSREQLLPVNQDDVIGSSSFLRKGGFLFTVEPLPDDMNTILVKESKSWLKKIHPFTYRLDEGIYGGVRMDINPQYEDNRELLTGKKKTEAVSQDEIQRNTIIAILKAKGNNQVTTKEIREILGISENDNSANNTLLSNIKRLKDSGEIISVKRGLYALPKTEKTKEAHETTQTIDEEPSIDFEEDDSE